MKIISLAIFLTMTSFMVEAQQRPDDIVKTFFKEYEKDPTMAVDNIYKTNTWISRIGDGITKIKSNIAELTPDFVGKYWGNELLLKKQLGSFLCLYSYGVKYDREPLRFTFIFYKPRDTWMLYSFKFDSDVDDELKDAAKLDRTDVIH